MAVRVLTTASECPLPFVSTLALYVINGTFDRYLIEPPSSFFISKLYSKFPVPGIHVVPMSTRGRPPGSAPRPTTRPDPSLTTRPVPSHRNFRPLCFGQGTASDPPFRTLVELDNHPDADPALSRELAYQRSLDEVRKLLDVICDQEVAANPDDVSCHIPTWGFRVFNTEYSPFVKSLCYVLDQSS